MSPWQPFSGLISWSPVFKSNHCNWFEDFIYGWRIFKGFAEPWWHDSPDSKIHGANLGPTWVLSAPNGPHVGPMNLAIREVTMTVVPVMATKWHARSYTQFVFDVFCCFKNGNFTQKLQDYFTATGQSYHCLGASDATLKCGQINTLIHTEWRYHHNKTKQCAYSWDIL